MVHGTQVFIIFKYLLFDKIVLFQTLKKCEEHGLKLAAQPRKMKTFDESVKSKKTVASMIEKKNEPKPKEKETKTTGTLVMII